MPIFQINKEKLIQIKEEGVKLEKNIQKLTEQNLELIFGLQFVSSEFQHNALRIDTLAFDQESNAFVIIEYKRDRSFSIIDQGYAYLALMLNNKAEFILEYNERTGKNLKRDDVDWSQSRVLFLANSFTPYQLNAIHFKDLPIELHEVKFYDNKTILYNQLKSPDTKESVKAISKDKTIEHVSREVKEYYEEEHLVNGTKGTELYRSLKERLQIIDENLEPRVTKYYIAYRLPGNWRNIFSFAVRKDKIILDFVRAQPKDFNDPEHKVLYRPDSMKNYNVHISRMEISNEKDLAYTFHLIQQQYARFISDFPNK